MRVERVRKGSDLSRAKKKNRGRRQNKREARAEIEPGASPGSRELWAILFLIAATLAAYWAVGTHPFIQYDDPLYVFENAIVRQGLTWEGVRWALTSVEVSNWHPLTWLSHMLDVELFGVDAAGAHHRVSLFWHVVNAVLTFAIFSRITGAFWCSLLLASVFALHPLHVESVAWVSERKDVLSQFFWLLMIWSYATYVRKLDSRWYVATGLCLGLGLMCKPMLVTAPFVLLLLDYWPLQRISITTRSGKKMDDGDDPPRRERARARKTAKRSRKDSATIGVPLRGPGALLLEKTPFFLMIVASSVVAYQAQVASGSVVSYSLSHRLVTAVTAYVRYIAKVFWPADLALLYPTAQGMWSGMQVAGALVGLVLISLLVLLWRRHRYLTVGWLFYLGTLVPVAGFVGLGGHSLADRYMYMPQNGLMIMSIWGIATLARSYAWVRNASIPVACLVLTVCFLLTIRQVDYWSSSVRLYEHSLRVTEDNHIMHNNLGIAYLKEEQSERAISQFEAAIRVRPSYVFSYVNLGTVYRDSGRLDQAAAVYREAVRVNPSYPGAHRLLGNALLKQQKLPDAIDSLRRALEMNANDAMTYHDLALALAMKGEAKEATQLFQAGLQRAPNDPWLHTSYGSLLRARGHVSRAIDHHRRALLLAPGAGPRNTLGESLLANKQLGEAIAEFRAALRIDPNHKGARRNLARAQQRRSPGAASVLGVSEQEPAK